MKKHALGLHTTKERQDAVRRAHQAASFAVKEDRVDWGIGYVQAMIDLAELEAPDDTEFLHQLRALQSDLALR